MAPWRWYVRVVAGNGEIVSISEGFVSKYNAKRHARRFHPDLEIREVER
jgi:hypothetical protein